MAVLKNDRVEVLEYLKRSVERMRQLALVNPDKFGAGTGNCQYPKVRDRVLAFGLLGTYIANTSGCGH